MTSVERAASVAVSSPFWCGPGRGRTALRPRFYQGLLRLSEVPRRRTEIGDGQSRACPSVFSCDEFLVGNPLPAVAKARLIRHYTAFARVQHSLYRMTLAPLIFSGACSIAVRRGLVMAQSLLNKHKKLLILLQPELSEVIAKSLR